MRRKTLIQINRFCVDEYSCIFARSILDVQNILKNIIGAHLGKILRAW